MSGIEIRLLGPGQADILANVADEVFDNPVVPALAAEFLAQPHCHLAVALDGALVVGFASAIDYVHPDKPRELFIDELGVSPDWQRRGIATRLLHAIFGAGRAKGCVTAWVPTETDNGAANGLYTAIGAKRQDGVVIYLTDLTGETGSAAVSVGQGEGVRNPSNE